MTSKEYKKYELVAEIVNSPADQSVAVKLGELCAIDFTTAFEMWEFSLAKHEGKNIDIEKTFAMFLRISEAKTRQLFIESAPLQKLVYGASELNGVLLEFLVNLILSNKPEHADESLRAAREHLREIVDAVFATYCARNGVKVPVLSKKQKELLLSHVDKIKGPNRALLMQRLKEL